MRPFVIRAALPYAAVVLGLVSAQTQSATAEAPPPAEDCIVTQYGPGLTPTGEPCRPPLPGPEEQAIAEASQRVGNAIIAMENGTGSQAQLTEAALALAKVRKEAPGVPVPNRIAAEISASLRVPVTALAQLTDNEVKSRLAAAQPEPGGVSAQWIPPGTFYPFEQRTSFYCGPATAESILYYLGSGAFRTARSYDLIFAAAPWYGYPTLLGPNETNTQLYPYSYLGWDQDVLADQTWLNTYAMGGTSWGKMKESLNKWTNQGTFYREVWTGGGGQTTERLCLARNFGLYSIWVPRR